MLKKARKDYIKSESNNASDDRPRSEPLCDTCGESSCTARSRRSDESDEEFEDRRRLEQRLCRIRRKIMVISGKGGVGKSTVAVNLAVALANSGRKVGLLDADIHGPSVPTMLGMEHATVRGTNDELQPVRAHGLDVVSMGFFLSNQDEAVIWRGPMKMGVIKQFLKDVAWGDLDCLVIDLPPGTGDEALSVCQLIGKVDGAIIVTTPQKVAEVDVRKSITFCRRLKVPVLGIVENMSGFVCPRCGETTQIMSKGGGRRIAEDMKVTYLGAIPMDPHITDSCDEGSAFISRYADSTAAVIMKNIADVVATLDSSDSH